MISSHPGTRLCCTAISTTASAPASAIPASASTRESRTAGGRGHGAGRNTRRPANGKGQRTRPGHQGHRSQGDPERHARAASFASDSAITGTEAIDKTDDHVSRSARSARGLRTTAQK